MRIIFLLFIVSFRVLAGSEVPSLPFTDAIQQILDRNISTLQQKQNVDAAEVKVLSSKLKFLPSLALEGSQSQIKTSDISDSYSSRSAQVSAQVNLFKFGGDKAALNAASRDKEAQEWLLRDVWIKAENEAAKILIQYIATKYEAQIQTKLRDLQAETLEIAKKRYNQGLLALQEVEKVAVDLDNVQANLRDTQVRTEKAASELDNLLGHHNIKEEWPWVETLWKFPEKIKETKLTLSIRQDWQAAKAQWETSKAQASQNWAKIFPSLDVKGSYGYSQQPGLGTEGSFWSGNIVLSIPLFNGLSDYSDYRKQVATQTQAELNLEKTKRLAESQWDYAKNSFAIAMESLTMRERTLKTSRKLFQDNLKRFQRGLINANELNVDQNRLFNTEILVTKGWAQAHQSFSEACLALGKTLGTCIEFFSTP